jgi:hypothetical protein
MRGIVVVLNRYPVLRDLSCTEDLRDCSKRPKLSPQANVVSPNNAGSKVVSLERKIDNLAKFAQMQEMLVNNLQAKCNFLEDRLKKDKCVSAKEASDNNVALLRTFFDLKAPSSVKTGVETIEEMKGLLQEFSDEKTDSVLLVRQVRGG